MKQNEAVAREKYSVKPWTNNTLATKGLAFQTANIWEGNPKSFQTDNFSLPRSGWCFWLVVPRESFCSTNQKLYPDLGRDTSSVWNFHACSLLKKSFLQENSVTATTLDLLL